MKADLSTAIERVCDANGIPAADAWSACERAVLAAAHEVYGDARRFHASYDPEERHVRLEVWLDVVDEVDNPNRETTPAELARVGVEAEHGERMGFPVWYLPEHADMAKVQDAQFGSFLGLSQGRQEFGRRAAEAARDALADVFAVARRRAIFDAYEPVVGQLVVGRVRRVGRDGTASVDLGGRVVGVLPRSHQAPRERLSPSEAVCAVVEEVSEVADHAPVTLSRASTGLVEALLPLIVPEVASGRVEVVRVAREAGSRTKVAVRQVRGMIDPVDTVVGPGGSRVRELRQAIGGEQVDVCEWQAGIWEMAEAAMLPAVGEWSMGEDFEGCEIHVSPEDMPIAMGPRGVNVRLASELAGVEIEVKEIEG